MPPAQHAAAYAYWLIPEEPLKSELRAIIDRLASAHKAATFDPHVTIYGGPSSDAEAHLIGQQIIKQYGPLDLAVQGLRHLDLFTKTFFIQFAELNILHSMSLSIKNASTEKADYELNPHLSLLYQHMAEEERQALCEQISLPKGLYRFDALRIIHTQTPTLGARAIKKWRSVFEAKLEGS